MQVLIILLAFICYSNAFVSISLSECQISKACFKSTKNCTTDQCEFLATWKSVKYMGKLYLEIEMIGTVKPPGGYVAIGFSDDKFMGNDGVVACINNPETSEISVVAGYNEASIKNNIIIPTSKLDKNFIVTSDGTRFGGNFNANVNKVSCRFLRLISPELHADKLKNLESGKQYYLLVALGSGRNLNGLNKHFAGSIAVSRIAIDFTSGTYNTIIGSSAVNSPLAKAHGILMILAWMICCAIGIIIARYYKDAWYRHFKKEGGWFNPHRGLQACGFILIVISVILIIIHVGGYSKLEDYPSKLHPIFGIIVIILFVMNPFVALCRCNINNKNRPIFNWIHFLIGIIAYILCIPTIMIGLKLPGAGLRLSQLNFPQWIVFIFVIFQVCIELILEIHGCLLYRENKDRKHFYEMEQLEHEKALMLNMNITAPQPPKQKGRKFRFFILGIYILVCIIVSLALIIIIIVN